VARSGSPTPTTPITNANPRAALIHLNLRRGLRATGDDRLYANIVLTVG
jgi:hypothetical protein